MAIRSPQRIPVACRYRYPPTWAKGPITKLFATSIQEGVLGLQFEDEIVTVGSGAYVATIAPPSPLRLLKLLFRPDYRIPSYYTKGFWCCEKDRLYEFLETLITQKHSPLHAWFKLFERNPMRDKIVYKLFPLKVKESIAAHYNTSPEFMKLILGGRFEYTCAFFDDTHTDLESAQDNKIDCVIRRLGLSAHHRILDIGCGWGQIAEEISRKTGARVTGINLSEGQVSFAQSNRSSVNTEFILTDYEAFYPDYKFDRIYSIGMVEHIGRGLLGNYFRKMRDLLIPDGRALIHCMVRRQPGSTNSWIDDQVFPGAYIPQLSEITNEIDLSELFIEQIFVHERSNYYRTLAAWINNFYRNERRLYDIISRNVSRKDAETIMKIWEFYLHGSRLVFNDHNGYCCNVQIILRT